MPREHLVPHVPRDRTQAPAHDPVQVHDAHARHVRPRSGRVGGCAALGAFVREAERGEEPLCARAVWGGEDARLDAVRGDGLDGPLRGERARLDAHALPAEGREEPDADVDLAGEEGLGQVHDPDRLPLENYHRGGVGRGIARGRCDALAIVW